MLPAGRVEDTVRQARAWLDRNADRPFFLFLHTFQVYPPYEPPAAYRSLFSEGEPAERAPSQRRAIADYDSEIRYVGDQLAELALRGAARARAQHEILPARYQPRAFGLRLGTDKLVRARDTLGTRSVGERGRGRAPPARGPHAGSEAGADPARSGPEREQTLRALDYSSSEGAPANRRLSARSCSAYTRM